MEHFNSICHNGTSAAAKMTTQPRANCEEGGGRGENGTQVPATIATSVAYSRPASPHNPPQPCGKGAGSLVTCPGHTKESTTRPRYVRVQSTPGPRPIQLSQFVRAHNCGLRSCVLLTNSSTSIGITHQTMGRRTTQPAGRQHSLAVAVASQPGSCTGQMKHPSGGTACATMAQQLPPRRAQQGK